MKPLGCDREIRGTAAGFTVTDFPEHLTGDEIKNVDRAVQIAGVKEATGAIQGHAGDIDVREKWLRRWRVGPQVPAIETGLACTQKPGAVIREDDVDQTAIVRQQDSLSRVVTAYVP